jgi:hypothetical protein
MEPSLHVKNFIKMKIKKDKDMIGVKNALETRNAMESVLSSPDAVLADQAFVAVQDISRSPEVL